MTGNNGYARPRALVTTDSVATLNGAPKVRLIEIDIDTIAYATGHIPGAIGWDWRADLQRQPVRDIPDRAEWESLLSRSGISNDDLIVLYGDNHNWFAAFAYWLFKLYGHADVRLMDGGRAQWLAEGREVTAESSPFAPTAYVAREPNLALRASREDVALALGRTDVALVDARTPPEYSGELLAPADQPQSGAQRGGHVPGAMNVPWSAAVAHDQTFKSMAELRAICHGAGIASDTETITYCRIGERSAHTWFVLSELLGYPNVRNYDGSWTEWGSLIGAPIER